MPSQYVCSKKGNSFYTQVTNSIFGFETSSIKLYYNPQNFKLGGCWWDY